MQKRRASFIKQLRTRKGKRRLMQLALLLLVVLLGLSAKPAYRAFREHRINANLEDAREAAQREDWASARDHARSVLLARQNDINVYRIWARALGKLGAPTTFLAAAELFTDSRATHDDMLEALHIMALQAPQAVAISAYASLPPPYLDEACFRAAMVPLLIHRGQVDLAERCVREVAKPGDPPMVRLELLRALCTRPDAARVGEARQILASLIADHADEAALSALLLLGDAPGGLAPGSPLPSLPDWLNGQNKATARHHLLGLNPQLAAEPESAPRLIDTAIKRFLTTDPGALGTWLNEHHQFALTVSTLEEAAKTDADAYIARLKAMQLSHMDSAFTEALAAHPPSTDLVQWEIVQANAAAQRGDAIAASGAWTRALNLAVYDNSRNRCLEIARTAEAAGAKEAAEDAWVAAVRLGWGPLPLYGDLNHVFTSLLEKGRSEDLTAMFRTLLRFEPNNPDLINNAYYFAMIHDLVPPGKVVTAMTQLIARNDQATYQSTLMLAAMMDGQAEAALACLPKCRDRPGVSPMMLAALEGTASILAGQPDAGTAILQNVDWTAFMSQERILFRNLLIKFHLSKLPLPELATSNTVAAPDQIPVWRKAVERFEKDSAGETLPALRVTKKPASETLAHSEQIEQIPAWRKAKEQIRKNQPDEVLPPLPPPPIPGAK